MQSFGWNCSCDNKNVIMSNCNWTRWIEKWKKVARNAHKFTHGQWNYCWCMSSSMNGGSQKVCILHLLGWLASTPLLHWFLQSASIFSFLSLCLFPPAGFHAWIIKRAEKRTSENENDGIYAAHDTRLKIQRVSKCIPPNTGMTRRHMPFTQIILIEHEHRLIQFDSISSERARVCLHRQSLCERTLIKSY